jgi:hypothetical protein
LLLLLLLLLLLMSSLSLLSLLAVSDVRGDTDDCCQLHGGTQPGTCW